MNEGRASREPVFFKRNRVRRVYDGGELFRGFFGDTDGDGKFPEEWIASTVRALNGGPDPREGLSVVEGSDLTLAELMEHERENILGGRKELGVLVKMLDSAVRLPMQAHPDSAFSQRYLNSRYGKTEMWLILATRGEACIHFGFRERITKEQFARAAEESRTNPSALEGLVNRVPVRPGEVYLIPAKTVHAIGRGCLILEVQEPTDFTVQPEYRCGETLLLDSERFLGLGPDAALDCFDYSVFGEDIPSAWKREPKLVSSCKGYRCERLIGPEDTPCFSVTRHTVWEGGSCPLGRGPAVLIVVEGRGRLEGPGGYEREIGRGSYFFLPYAAKGFRITSKEGIAVVSCRPPAL